MIEFICGICGVRLRVGRALGGRKARCPGCREVIQVPKQETTRRYVPKNCERCNRPILPNEMTREIDDKTYCSYCLTDLGYTEGGSMHDPESLGIPGMVVLKGKLEREAARRFLDSQAEKQYEGEEDEEPEGGEDTASDALEEATS